MSGRSAHIYSADTCRSHTTAGADIELEIAKTYGDQLVNATYRPVALIFHTAGNYVLNMQDGATVTLTGVPAGMQLNCSGVKSMDSTSGSSLSFTALYTFGG